MLRIRIFHFLLIPLLFTGLIPGPTASAAPYSALVAEIDSERPLFQRNADELRHPASLTKMMTLYLVFEALVRGEISKQTRLRASHFAVLRPPSRMGLVAGHSITVEQGILALVTRSANDAAATIAEGLGGSESAFAFLMNEKAQRLGMNHTLFRNASGLPDPRQVTTAWDMFRLAKALNKHFPQYYGYFSTPNFEYDGQNFGNHNHLLNAYPGADGIKTGFVNASGFNLVASARRGGYRLVGVVFGGNTAAARDTHMRHILDDGFDQLEGRAARFIQAPFDQPEHYTLLRGAPFRHESGHGIRKHRAALPSARPGNTARRGSVSRRKTEGVRQKAKRRRPS
ncbi:D-alanyl-D-alanine carboxypeptidase [Candidatus Woesearchaeota archaeon]|nr:D-alanyl-D-alanine carboxypeptidase [Candidatus Woesearchaeota archaeon]